MRECRAFDVFTLGTQRVVDEDTGFLTVPGVIAKAGNVQTYRASELGLDGDPNRIVKLYRPREEVAKSAPSFARRPITNNHPAEKWITSKNWAKYAVGDAGATVDMQGDDMVTTLQFRQQKSIDDLQSGKVALSNGYRFRFDDSKTRTPEGEAVDGFMTDIRGNHIALVDRGRGGPGCVVADEDEEKKMATRTTKIGKLSFELDVTAADAVDVQRDEMTKLAADCEAAEKMASESEKRAVEAEAQVKTHLTKIAALDAEIANLKANPAAPAAEVIEAAAELRQSVINDALGLVPDLVTKGKTVDAIRREALTAASAKLANVKAVVDSIMRGVGLDKADPVVVDNAFSAACSVAKTAAPADKTLGAALLGKDPKAPKANDATAADADPTANLTGYALYAYRLTHPKKAQPTA